VQSIPSILKSKRGMKEKRHLVTHTRFILGLGMFLATLAPAPAQTPAPRIVLAQEHVAAVITILPTLTVPLPAPFLLFKDSRKSNVYLGPILFPGAYRPDYSLEPLSPMDEVKTLILTQSSLPLLQFWGGRVQLEAFQSSLHSQNLQPAGFGNSMRSLGPTQQGYPGGPRSVHLSGLSLSFYLGREARTGHPSQLWRRLTRTVTAVLN
jgi:hypothetical protein